MAVKKKGKYIAVVDIGKTNKKLLVYDTALNLLDSTIDRIPEYTANHINFEDVSKLTGWLKNSLATFNKKYPLDIISVTTHGATAFCLDSKGKLSTPPVAYTTETDDSFSSRFFSRTGSREELQQKTATAEIGSMVNVAKKIFFLQQTYPERFKKTTNILYMPQYLGFLLTGNIGCEPTYAGCHTYLLDPYKKKLSFVADKLGIRKQLPADFKNSWDILGHVSSAFAGATGLSTECRVTMGVHDSNSSLVPFLIKKHNFILNSTGTWCVAMHPCSDISFSNDELGKPVFYNMNISFDPVKTVVFLGGMEFDTYTSILKQHCGMQDFPVWEQDLYQQVLTEKKLFFLPSVLKGAGIFPESVSRVIENGKSYSLTDIKQGHYPPCFADYKLAYAALNISLAIQTCIAFKMAGFDGEGQVFTEGGFRNNLPYNKLVSALLPQSPHFLSNLKQATAFGAALLAKAALENKTPFDLADAFSLDLTAIEKPALSAITAYQNRYLALLR
ncbi:MAG TPA: FGGY family carbohydrate kinase [Spirochaetota bacterium]|nr:FGGY family carbohydrate kinase [Spirochaetota bacterium]